MNTSDINEIVARAVKLATRSAMNGSPLATVLWVPPTTTAQDWRGTFVAVPARPISGSQRPEWE